jgi:hypothetical protein
MSLRHRVKVAALFGGIVAVVLLGVWGLQQQQKKSEAAKAGATYEHQKANQAARAVLLRKPPAPDPNPERKEWREENDLKAQREMADWAFGMLIASSIGVIITSLGVWFVRETLIATRRMIGEAASATQAAHDAVSTTREIGEAQVRAYLSVRRARFFVEPMFLHIELDITNSGQSPARSVQVSASVTIQFDYGDRTRPLDPSSVRHHESESEIIAMSEVGAGSSASAKVVLPATRLGDAIAHAIDTSPFQVKCRVDWLDVFDKAQFSETVLSTESPNNPRLGDGWIRQGELTTRRSNYQNRNGQQV